MRLEDYQPSNPAEVSCESSDGKSTLVFIREIGHDPKQVWSAITDAEKIAKWAPYKPDRNLDAIGPVVLKMIDGSEPEIYESEVYEVIDLVKLTYSWGSSGVLCWSLEPYQKGTKLTLRHTVENPDWIVLSAAGWHICLDFVDLMLSGHEIGPVVGEAVMEFGWLELANHYAEVLGMNLVLDEVNISQNSKNETAKE